MTEHLPECEWSDNTRVNRHCICPALRACEQRVFHEQIEGRQHDMVMAYLRGLDAARDAVADCRVPWPTATGVLVNEGIDDALAAIDALREEQK